MELIEYRIEGLSPLLMNSPGGMMAGQAKGATAAAAKKLAPEDEAEQGAYKTVDGDLYLPSIAFRSALLNAVKMTRINKVAARSVLAASVFNVDEQSVLTDPDTGDRLREYAIDIRRCVLNTTAAKPAILRARPRLDRWATTVRFEVDPFLFGNIAVDEVIKEYVTPALEKAGRMIGVGNYRPEKSGPYGRFRVL